MDRLLSSQLMEDPPSPRAVSRRRGLDAECQVHRTDQSVVGDDLVLLRLAEVERMIGHKKSWIYANPDFPKPLKLGGNRWVKSEVQAFIRSKVMARDASAMPADHR